MIESKDNFDDKNFKDKVHDIVGDIPEGYVLTYGMIALLAGRPANSRLVGRFMSQAPKGLPAHRVVNHAGRPSPGWPEQVTLLKQEHIFFKENGCVDLKRHLWRSQ